MPKYAVGDTVFLNPKQAVTDAWPSFSWSMRGDAEAGMAFTIVAGNYNQIRGVHAYRIQSHNHSWAVREEWIVAEPPKKKPFNKRSRMY